MGSVVSGCVGSPVQKENTEEDKPKTSIPTKNTVHNTASLNFEAPVGVPAKLEYAFATRAFDRIVLPDKVKITREHLAEQTAQVIRARTLGTVTNIVQTQDGWQQKHYIRCNEVTWAVQNSQVREAFLAHDIVQQQINAVIQTISGNKTQTVLTENDFKNPKTDENPLSLVTLGLALHQLDTVKRNAIEYVRPPSLSWTFIRLIDKEQERWFWHILWRIAGADPDEFSDFIKSPDKQTALKRLEHVFNRFEVLSYKPTHRTPDIVVIIGANFLKDSAKRSKNPTSNPLMVWPLLEALAPSLQQPHTKFKETYLKLVGKTRFIVLIAS